MSEVVADECIIQTKNTPINEPLSRAREGVFDILEIDSDSDGNNIIFCDEDGKKIAIITYYLKPL